MEYYGVTVEEKSRKVGSNQRITTNDGTVFPVNIHCGLPYLDMRLFTDQEWDKLPHVMITYEVDWDLEVLDNEISNDQDWYDSIPSTPLLFPLFDEQGSLQPQIMAQHHAIQALAKEEEEEALTQAAQINSIQPDPVVVTDDHGSGTDSDIDASTDCCIYYTNLHWMVPINLPEMPVCNVKI